jgi:predicted dithiol-disulfide oxidoreductase (DUF899 family)
MAKYNVKTIEEILKYKQFLEWQFDYLTTRDGYAKYYISTKTDLGDYKKGQRYNPNFVLEIPEELSKQWGEPKTLTAKELQTLYESSLASSKKLS